MNGIPPTASGTTLRPVFAGARGNDAVAPQLFAANKIQGTGHGAGEEQHRLRELRERDREVRAREAAIRSAADHNSGALFTYERGPDGRLYAVRGASSIQLNTDKAPLRGLQQAETVRLLALTQPTHSFRDLAVAAHAVRAVYELRMAMLEEAEAPAASAENRKAAAVIAHHDLGAYSAPAVTGTGARPALFNISV